MSGAADSGVLSVHNQTLYLVSCVKSKAPDPALAKDLYISAWFRKARHYVEQRHAPWLILSAEHGLVSPDELLAPYDRTLNAMGVAQRRAWAQRVRSQMDRRLPYVTRIVIFAGKKYREYLMDYLRGRAATVEVPLEHLGRLQQLAWFNKMELNEPAR